MKTKGAEFIWFDGRFVRWDEATVPIMTHALHYGTAVFEGIRAYASRNNLYIFKLNEHMERLHRSASVYSITLNYTAKELCEATTQLLKKNRTQRVMLYKTFDICRIAWNRSKYY
jgi:branched-chain amino acid aminotransferase